MVKYSDRFSKLPDGRVLDDAPMADGKPPVVWDGKSWTVFEGTVGSFGNSKPLSDEEVLVFKNHLLERGITSMDLPKDPEPSKKSWGVDRTKELLGGGFIITGLPPSSVEANKRLDSPQRDYCKVQDKKRQREQPKEVDLGAIATQGILKIGKVPLEEARLRHKKKMDSKK